MMKTCALAALAAGMAVSGCVAVPVVAGGAALTRGVVQERSTLTGLKDTDIQLGVATRLGNHSGELYRDVEVDVTEGAVVLTGTVPRAGDKVAATEAAWATPGVLSVEDAMEVATDAGTGSYLADANISTRLRYELVTDWAVSAVNYTVTTVDRTVHLTGIARSREELVRVIDHARSVEGVRRVVSHVLTIDDPRRVARIARGG
ncbi:MAG: BON domain-containing protein [Pseudomonadota bacterium]